jgi:hypothetical protein
MSLVSVLLAKLIVKLVLKRHCLLNNCLISLHILAYIVIIKCVIIAVYWKVLCFHYTATTHVQHAGQRAHHYWIYSY